MLTTEWSGFEKLVSQGPGGLFCMMMTMAALGFKQSVSQVPGDLSAFSA